MLQCIATVCLNVQQFVQFVVAHCFTTDSTGFMAKHIEPSRCTSCLCIYNIYIFLKLFLYFFSKSFFGTNCLSALRDDFPFCLIVRCSGRPWHQLWVRGRSVRGVAVQGYPARQRSQHLPGHRRSRPKSQSN